MDNIFHILLFNLMLMFPFCYHFGVLRMSRSKSHGFPGLISPIAGEPSVLYFVIMTFIYKCSSPTNNYCATLLSACSHFWAFPSMTYFWCFQSFQPPRNPLRLILQMLLHQRRMASWLGKGLKLTFLGSHRRGTAPAGCVRISVC